jgi:phosphate starvation-inducible PhoH-like protein
MARERLHDVSEDELRALFGPLDRNLRALRERYGVRVTLRHDVLLLEGEDTRVVTEVTRRAKHILERLRRGEDLAEDRVSELLLEPGADAEAAGPAGGAGGRGARHVPGPGAPGSGFPGQGGRFSPGAPGRLPPGRAASGGGGGEIRPKTPNQERYVRAIRHHDVVFSIGPAGTGKTFLAVVEAVSALRAGSVRRIVLTRPAVEAGEKLGFLPGDFQAKINPYLRPLYDALGELLPYGEMQRYVASDVIEIVPLAYMRGRTLKDAFIILDEAQNTTPAQMKMFLTRLGMGAKTVVTGDVTQVDLPEGVTSGLVHAIHLLGNVPGIEVVRFMPQDILRHPLVQRIVDAYDSQARPNELPFVARAQDEA